MSEANVEIVRQVYAAAARHDAATVLALYDPEVEWDNSRGLGTGGGVYLGHEGLRHFFREWREAWEYPEEVPEELFDAGEHVISVATVQNRGRTSGAEVEWTQCGVWTIREGKIIRVAWFRTRSDALEAAGLRE